MAANEFATLLHRNTHRITLILVYAILEWILIFLLLLNSLLSFLISKFVNYFGLEPPYCICCSSLEENKSSCSLNCCSKFDHRKQNREEGVDSLNVKYPCASFGTCCEIDPLVSSNQSGSELDTQRYNQDEFLSELCSSHDVEEKDVEEVFNNMEIGELVSSIIMAMQDLVTAATEETESPCKLQEKENEGNDECESSNDETKSEYEGMDVTKDFVLSSSCPPLDQQCKENKEHVASNDTDIMVTDLIDLELNEMEEKTEKLPLEKSESGTKSCCDENVISETEFLDEDSTIEKLKLELRDKQETLNALCAELEEERNASAISASQTMSMISRLQEEKASMQMEAQQYQRMMEEQSNYDQEALQLLNELVVKPEKELEVYRSRVFGSEINEDKNGLHFQEMVDTKNSMSIIDESVEEYEEERLSVLEELKALEIKLVTLANNDEKLLEDVNPNLITL